MVFWTFCTLLFSSHRTYFTFSRNITSNLPETGASVVWWRSTGIKHSSNNIYFDFIEDLDAILDRSGYFTFDITTSIDHFVFLIFSHISFYEIFFLFRISYVHSS